MTFILRIQTSQGTHRISFPSKNATFGDLQSSIQQKYGIAPDAQVLSRSRPNNPDFIDNAPANTRLIDMKLSHGTMLYLIMVKNQIDSFKATKAKNQAIEQKDAMDVDDDDTDQKYQSQPQKKKAYALKPLNQRTKRATSKKLADLKNDKDEIADAGPKHIPFHEYIEERQRKLAKTQPWNIDPPKYNYKR